MQKNLSDVDIESSVRFKQNNNLVNSSTNNLSTSVNKEKNQFVTI